MAVIAWPSALQPVSCELLAISQKLVFRSPFGGFSQIVDQPGSRWRMSITLPAQKIREAGRAEGFLMQLTLGVDTVQAYHFGRPAPRGTMRGTPALSAAAVRGATSFAIDGSVSGVTLRIGDMIGAAGQLFMVKADVTVASGGTATVQIMPPVRADIPIDTLVIWDKPTANFVMASNTSSAGFTPGWAQPLQLELDEVF